MEIVKGEVGYEELIPLMDKAFNKHFKKLIPKLYLHKEYEKNHYAVKSDGEVVGALASVPIVIKINEDSLIGAGIGQVCTKKKFRGKGVMDLMVRTAIADGKKDGYDFMYLGGWRQRYQRYGFTPALCNYIFNLSLRNLKGIQPKATYTFKKLKRGAEEFVALKSLYEEMPVHVERDYFEESLRNWAERYKIYGVYDERGALKGYFQQQLNLIVNDICLASDVDYTDFIYSLIKSRKPYKGSRIRVLPSDERAISSLAQFAQMFSIATSEYIVILNYKSFLSKLLPISEKNMKRTYETVLAIEGEEKNIRVKCDEGFVSVTETDDAPDVRLPLTDAAAAIMVPTFGARYGLPFSIVFSVSESDCI